MPNRFLCCLCGLIIAWAGCGSAAAGDAETRSSRPPNVVILLADDLGFSDIGCYGSEIATPHLDRLAAEGLRFTQFYNTARCWPTRAAILTGYYAQQVRRDAMPGVKSGSQGLRPAWAKLLPERLRKLGYRNYHSGKWHVDGKPMENGFDHSYNVEDHNRHFAPKQHFEDDKPLPPVDPNSNYYSTTAIADHAVKCLKEHQARHSDKPFFEYLAFISPHFPLHAPAEAIARYDGKYLSGWDALRDQRWKRIQEGRLVGGSLSPVEREVGPPYPFPDAIAKLGPDEVNRPVEWKTLSSSQQKFQAAKMAVHAAMVSQIDQDVGRVIDQIRAMNQLDDTLIFFLSDNGASAEMMVRGDGHDANAPAGSGATFLSLGPGWSSLANTPFRRHKTWVHEGGIATPLIACWPKGIPGRGELRHEPAHVIDLVPTILSVAGGTPFSAAREDSIPSLPGKNLQPLFAREGSVEREFLWWLHEGNAALRAGDWKIVKAGKESRWELYNLKVDRCETRNLAEERPDKVRELLDLYNRQYDQTRDLVTKDLPQR